MCTKMHSRCYLICTASEEAHLVKLLEQGCQVVSDACSYCCCPDELTHKADQQASEEGEVPRLKVLDSRQVSIPFKSSNINLGCPQ